MSTAKPTAIVVGGGLGGLWATLRLVEAGVDVDLFALFEVKRSHSACAQGGINAVLDTKGQGDTIWQHIVDTIKGGAYLADQPPIKTMCEEAPGLIRTFERMGVTFSRTPEGLLDLRLFGGVKYKRTVFAGSSTGQQLLYGVDEQVRRYEDQGLVRKHEWWEMLSLVLDGDGRCRGITALDLRVPESGVLRRRRRRPGHRRPGPDLRQVHQLLELHRRRRQPGLPAGRRLHERGVHPVPPHRDDRRRQAAADERGLPRRGGAHLDPASAGRSPRRQVDPRGRAVLLPRGVVPGLRQHRAARRGLPRHLEGGQAPGARGAGPGPGVPGPHPPAARLRAPPPGLHHRDLRGVHRRGPVRDPHGDLPRPALQHGRPLGGLREGRRRRHEARQPAQPPDERPGPVRLRRVRRRLPRGQPPGGQLPVERLLQRTGGRGVGRRLHQGPGPGRPAGPGSRLRGGAPPPGGGQPGAHGLGRRREPLHPAPRTGPDHDRQGGGGTGQPLSRRGSRHAWPTSRSGAAT